MGKLDPLVKLTWCGAEPTLISAVRGDKKTKIKPGETVEVNFSQAQNYLKQGRFLVGATKSEIDALVKKSKDAHKRLLELQKDKAEAKTMTVKNEEKADEEEVEEVEEEEKPEVVEEDEAETEENSEDETDEEDEEIEEEEKPTKGKR